MEPTVTREQNPDRYEITVDGDVAGFAQFLDRDNQRIFFHTEIGDEFGGRGLAAVLVENALNATREGGLRVVPVCPFVKKYVTKNTTWADMVDPVRQSDIDYVREHL